MQDGSYPSPFKILAKYGPHCLSDMEVIRPFPLDPMLQDACSKAYDRRFNPRLCLGDGEGCVSEHAHDRAAAAMQDGSYPSPFKILAKYGPHCLSDMEVIRDQTIADADADEQPQAGMAGFM
jgi:hypothetical protein